MATTRVIEGDQFTGIWQRKMNTYEGAMFIATWHKTEGFDFERFDGGFVIKASADCWQQWDEQYQYSSPCVYWP